MNHEQNAKETITGLINKIFKFPTFRKVRFTIIITIAISFITIFYNSVLFSCQLILLQNVLLIYATILMLFSAGKIFDRSERIKLGVSVAAILGTIYASITLLISNIQYYFLGFRERAFLVKGLVAPPTTIQTLWIELSSQIYLLLILVLVSAFVGFLASVTRQRKM
jgi:hypothetical protein